MSTAATSEGDEKSVKVSEIFQKHVAPAWPSGPRELIGVPIREAARPAKSEDKEQKGRPIIGRP